MRSARLAPCALMAATRSWSRDGRAGSSASHAVLPAMRIRIVAERARIAADLAHQVDAVGVGRRLDLARIARSAAPSFAAMMTAPPPTKSPSSMPNRNDRPAACSTERGAVAVGDMADLVREHAGELVGRLSPCRSGPRTRRCARPAARWRWRRTCARTSDAERDRQRGRLFELARPACRRPRGRLSRRRRCRIRTRRRLLGVEHAADLRVDGSAEPALDPIGHERREPRGDRRHAEDGDEQQRDRRGDAPDDDLARLRRSLRPLRSIGTERSSIAAAQRRVADFEPRQHRAADAAEAQHALRAPTAPRSRRRAIRRATAPSAARMRSAAGASSTVTSCRALVTPSKIDAGARCGHRSLRSRRRSSASARPSPTAEAGAPTRRHPVERRDVGEIERFHDDPPQSRASP